jgi:hypothetical protein
MIKIYPDKIQGTLFYVKNSDTIIAYSFYLCFPTVLGNKASGLFRRDNIDLLFWICFV